MVKNMLQRGDWLIKLDLKDAYFCVPIANKHRRFLRFQWRNKTYQFQCLPFGLGQAPRDFTKIMKVPMGFLRRLGIRLVIYLDDILVMNQNSDHLLQEGKTTCTLLENLGFVINQTKSVFQPTQVVEFLGIQIDTTRMQLSLSLEKMEAIKQACANLLQHKTVTVRELAEVVGKLSATMQAVLTAPLHYRRLQMLKTRALLQQKSYSAMVTLTKEAQEELHWWIHYLQDWNCRAIISPGLDMVVETDASKTGWGAVCQSTEVSGLWTTEESKEHINVLEMKAVTLALQILLRNSQGLHVHLSIDNQTVVANINKMGSPRSEQLTAVAKALWDYCLNRQVLLSAEHLPGVKNIRADRLSRKKPESSDWKLDPQTFQCLMKAWAPCHYDLFASRQNTQLDNYVSWRPDPGAAATDAFLMKWTDGLNYAFPPFCMIARCLAKLRREESELILITPVWNTQPWYPDLLELSCKDPILLPPLKHLLLSPSGTPHPMITSESFRLAAWRVSGERSKHQAYQSKQLSCWGNHGDQVPEKLMETPGKSGLAGVLKGKLIPFRPLWT